MLKSCLLVTLPALVVCAGEVREEILVVVNNHIVTRRAFQQAVEQEGAALYRQFSGQELDEKLSDTRSKTLQGLIDSFLLQDKAVDLGIQVTDDQLAAILEDIKRENHFQSNAEFEQALRTSVGISLEDYLKHTRQRLIQQEVLRHEVFARVAVGEEELIAYYEDHKDEFRQPSRFRVRELVLPTVATPEEQQAVQAQLDEIQDALKTGKSFEELVKTYSMSPTRDQGGDLGWMTPGLLVAPVEEAALGLDVNQISTPIKTDLGIYMVQMIAREADVTRTFPEVREKILERLQEPKAQSAIESYLSGLRARANIRYTVPKDLILKG